MTHRRKKLIEVALPLEAINREAAREKSIRHGHPSTLHLWWARRPLAACRAVLFAQLVDDPSSDPQYRIGQRVDEERAGEKRAELFNLIEDLVKWENSNNPDIINKARAEIARCVASRKIERGDLKQATVIFGRDEGQEHPNGPISTAGVTAYEMVLMRCTPEVVNHFLATHAPPVLDPFAGGGSIPLEAQRLGLRAHASDLNPVPVLINKALIEIPPKFAGQPPVNPKARSEYLGARASGPQEQEEAGGTPALPGLWHGARGLAEDVRYYGEWMRNEAEKRIGHLYPKVKITQDMIDAGRDDLEPYRGQELTVIAWLWARTVASPDPSVGGAHVPLVRSFWLSKKKGKEAYIQPVVDRQRGTYEFKVYVRKPTDGFDPEEGTVCRQGGTCLLSKSPIPFHYIRNEGKNDRIFVRLMAIVCEGNKGRVYLPPLVRHADDASISIPQDIPSGQISHWPGRTNVVEYGLDFFEKLFTPRQLTALTTFSDLVSEAHAKIIKDHRAQTPGSAGVSPASPAQWHSRGYLPHFEAGEAPQSITFRLHDSLPAELRAKWEAELKHLPQSRQQRERRARIETALDTGYGACYLREPAIARLVQDALQHFDGERYRLHAWCVMPNHVHVLATPLGHYSLSSILHAWKSFTSHRINTILGRRGPVWLEEYFDRVIRDERHFTTVVEYIESNPVKAGLARKAGDWVWGSAAEQGASLGARASRPQPLVLAGETPALPGGRSLDEGGTGPRAYADAVATYLGFALSKQADLGNSLCAWEPLAQCPRHLFGRQAIPIVWDYAEGNPLGASSGAWTVLVDGIVRAFSNAFGTIEASIPGDSQQASAGTQDLPHDKIVSTDPPYYDNIGYADLSDFFYVWLRRTLKNVYPSLLSTMLTPKAQELIASPYRHKGSKDKAARFFEEGLGNAIGRWCENGHQDYPTSIFYAFKQAETDKHGTASTGWETFLTGVIHNGFSITGTWPMRTENRTRLVGMGTNALASSIVLSCVPRSAEAGLATRREFLTALSRELPDALRTLQAGHIAPVDLAQAAIGPGMALFSRYAKVIEADGSSMSVRAALALINQALDEVLAEHEGEFDADTRWAVAWFEQYGFEAGDFGVAETLSKAKNTSVQGLVEAGVVKSRSGTVQLLSHAELSADWDPLTDDRLTEWEATHYLIRALDLHGERGASDMLRTLGSDYGEKARALAYRLYNICERKKWASEATAYNSLVIAWPEMNRLALAGDSSEGQAQATLLQ